MDEFELELVSSSPAKIKVVGVGGAGGNAVNRMVQGGIRGVEFIAINTDKMALDKSLAHTKIAIGQQVTRGLGAGANPTVGRDAIIEDKIAVEKALEGADMVFIAAGMGGGTGTGAAPIVAEICRDLGILSLAVVTKPFKWEFPVRQRHSLQGLDLLHTHVDTLITIPNNKILAVAGKNMTVNEAFAKCDEVLMNAVKGVTEIIQRSGIVGIDFADIRSVVENGGDALMGTGTGEGDKRALLAAEAAISSPLLEDASVAGATGLLIHITSGPDFCMAELDEAMTFIQNAVGEEVQANTIFGLTENPDFSGQVAITVIATGFGRNTDLRSPKPSAAVAPAAEIPVRVAPARTPVTRPEAAPAEKWVSQAQGGDTVTINNREHEFSSVGTSKFEGRTSYEESHGSRPAITAAPAPQRMSNTERLQVAPVSYADERVVPPFLRPRKP